MSVFGVPTAAPFQRIRSSAWNAMVAALDYLYLMNMGNVNALISGTFSPYFYSVYAADGGFFGSDIYVNGYKVLHDQDPIYIASFLQDALNQIYNYISVYLVGIQSIVQQTQTLVQQIKLYVSPTALTSFVLPVLQSPTPLVSASTPIKRALLYVTNDTAYVVYVGGPSGQHFPIFPGTQVEIDVCDAIQIYLRSENYSYVRALLELTAQSTCN